MEMIEKVDLQQVGSGREKPISHPAHHAPTSFDHPHSREPGTGY